MIRVTDHALVRFLQRSGAADVEQLRWTIAAGLERGRRAAERIGLVDYVIVADGLKFVVEAGVVVTVLDPGMRAKQRMRRR
ncbi:hypothetical protein SAMN05428997_14627 [Bosea sp. CRIB-10]|uniref:hypothetical protein n=1 Tax=Bosea sp. CRIB-10 TaxID=378404 RepID=UPI0008EAEF94|nr:hypothetical protein [Bosea sp. CRIB-10]SFD72979.1 hypothetical protein SAMN05428997_14627 [Bosea sp. CRIB-10]